MLCFIQSLGKLALCKNTKSAFIGSPGSSVKSIFHLIQYCCYCASKSSIIMEQIFCGNILWSSWGFTLPFGAPVDWTKLLLLAVCFFSVLANVWLVFTPLFLYEYINQFLRCRSFPFETLWSVLVGLGVIVKYIWWQVRVSSMVKFSLMFWCKQHF